MTTENSECNISFMLEDDSNNENIDVSIFQNNSLLFGFVIYRS